MTGLVLEGGTFRGIFSAGVMDAFLKADIEFPYIIVVSAGISNAYSYISGQYERNIVVLEEYRNDNRYLGFNNFIKNRSYFGLDFIFSEIPNNLNPFDGEKFMQYKGKAIVGVTNAQTGKTEYLNALEHDENFVYLRATCAIPGVFPAVNINGQDYFDGGLRSPICIKKAIQDGCKKTVILLTRPKGFVKELRYNNIILSQLIKFKYPAMEMALLTRHKLYNAQIRYCEKLERQGRAIILRPEQNLSSLEKNPATLRATWQEGYNSAMERIDEIRGFMAIGS